ncbi:MAG TPA: hypothetical protein PLP42_16185 [Acidobacteriota bacterium]|jgi:hypothetical protein|nr:hypothetical protein [Acidobacteriota bacterium]
MNEERGPSEAVFLRIGAISAIVGTPVTMAAGSGFDNLTNQAGPQAVLQTLASYPGWYWPIVHLGFIFGATLWAFAFVALARSLTPGPSRALGSYGAIAMVLGVAVHIVDSSISGFGLSSLATAWATAPAAEQTILVRQADTFLHIIRGTWVNVLNFYSGLPFILAGLGIAVGTRYPPWLGWIGLVGGLGSLLMGILMFLRLDLIPQRVYIGFAILASLWLLVIGVLMWVRRPDTGSNDPI